MNHVKLQNVMPFDFNGLQIRDLTPESLPSASVAQIEVAPGAAHAREKSIKSDKLYICVDGTLIFKVENMRIELEPMDLLVIRKNEWFDYHNESTKTVTVLLIHVPPFDLKSEVFES